METSAGPMGRVAGSAGGLFSQQTAPLPALVCIVCTFKCG